MVKFGWDKLKRFLAQANTWSGTQTFSSINVTGGTIAGATITENFTTLTDPATNAAVTTAIVNSYNGVIVTLTAAGNTQTLQSPTTTATIRKFMVINNDTSNNSLSVVANSVTFTLTAGEGQCFLWDGSAWGPTDLGITSIPVPIIQGGTGAATAQAAINTLTAVASATNEHVLTKDTATGNAIFKAAAGGTGTGDMLLGTAQIVTASKTFGDDLLILAGSTSGTIKLNAADEAGTTTVTFPATTGTVQIAGENVTVGAGKTLGFAPATELTIAAGAVTAAQVLHLIDTESDAASDDLVTINGGVDGLQLEIRAAHTDRTVVIKETGNILTGGSDIRLDDTNKYILFTYDGALSKWVVVGAAQNAVTFATAGEITTGTEPAKAIAPDQLALTKYNGDWSFWGIKNLRLIDVHAGDATRVIVNPSAYNIPLLIGEHWHVMTAGVDVDSVDDLDTGALAAGTDYYIYACTDGTTLSFKVSANATNPTGFDAAHSRKIGGFHTLCVAVGTISGHPLTDYAVKDILPASIWDLKHRAKTLVNVGLVYDSKIQKWVDIYLASGTGANTTSVNGGTISDTRNWMDFVDDGLAVGKRLLTDTEFTSIATGSNEETNITGSADPGTTSGHVDTAGRRMISNIGCEDCCGVVWQWIQDQSYYYYGASPYWGNLPGGKGSSYGQFAADPGADEVNNSDSGGDVKLIAGGNWSHAAGAGSRSRNTTVYRWTADSALGARFVSEPL